MNENSTALFDAMWCVACVCVMDDGDGDGYKVKGERTVLILFHSKYYMNGNDGERQRNYLVGDGGGYEMPLWLGDNKFE